MQTHAPACFVQTTRAPTFAFSRQTLAGPKLTALGQKLHRRPTAVLIVSRHAGWTARMRAFHR